MRYLKKYNEQVSYKKEIDDIEKMKDNIIDKYKNKIAECILHMTDLEDVQNHKIFIPSKFGDFDVFFSISILSDELIDGIHRTLDKLKYELNAENIRIIFENRQRQDTTFGINEFKNIKRYSDIDIQNIDSIVIKFN